MKQHNTLDTSPTTKTKVVIIGAGLGGLAAGIRALAEGCEVLIVEKNGLPGGKMSEIRRDGFRFDTGPSLLTMPFVADALFAAVGKKRGDYCQFDPIEPVCRYFFESGASLDALTDIDTMADAIEKIAPGDGSSYRTFFRKSKELYDLTAEIFLFTPFQEWRKLLKKRYLPALLQLHKLDSLRSMHRANSSRFRSKELIQLFDRFATYNGSNPYQAPATLNIIPYVEHGLGAYYVRGGMYRLAEALARLFTESGGTILYNTPVRAIRTDRGIAKGISIPNQKIDADLVICNADVAVAQRLLLIGDASDKARTDALEPSLSGMAFLWGVRGENEQLAHHNIFFSGNYKNEFEQIFAKKIAPTAPTVYAAITSKTDPNDAPPGYENWFVLLNMPYTADGQDWKMMQEYSRDAILRALAKRGITLEEDIVSETVLTPQYFEQHHLSNRGSIYGFSSNSMFSAFLRPANRSPKIRNLFYCGGSSHPGGGIPLVLLSGMIAAEIAIEEAHTSLIVPPIAERLRSQ